MAFAAAVVGSSTGMRISNSTPSHTLKPGRRRGNGLRKSLTTIPSLFLLLLVLLSGHAQALVLDEPLGLARLRAVLAPRQDPLSNGGGAAQSTTTKPTKTSSKSATTKSTATSESQGSQASSTGTSQPQLTGVPKVFDQNVGNNFTNTACPQFLRGLSDNDSFNNCLPLSLLVASSQSFLEDWSTGLLPQVLDDTCNVVLPTCNNLMQNLALKLKAQDTCADDFAKGNPLVQQAYYAFLSYKPMYQAGCLKVSDKDAASASAAGAQPTGGLSSGDVDGNAGPEYCYVATTANNSAPVNAYIYTLPLGSPLPAGGGDVNCTDCLKQTMNYFAQAATNATSPLASLYPSAAQEINSKCGKNFVQSSVQVDQSTKPNSAGSLQASVHIALAVTALVVFGL